MDTQKSNSSDSPKVTKREMKFSKSEPVVGILIALVASIVFYFFPQVIAIVFVSGPVIPTFDVNVINGPESTLWIPILLWALLRIGVEIAYFVERRYTKRLAVITMIGNVFAFICTLVIFLPDTIMNPEHIEWVRTHYIDNAAWFADILANANLVVIGIMLISLILDSITVVKKGFRANRVRKYTDDIYAKEIKAEDLEGETDK